MSPSPHTPRHSRQSSSIDMSYNQTSSYQHSSPGSSPNVRRASKSSFQDAPLTPLRNSMNESELAQLSSGGSVGHPDDNSNNGLGNLADELADALDGSGDEDEYYEDGEGPSIIQDDEQDDSGRAAAAAGDDGVRDSGVDVAAAKNARHKSNNPSLSVPPTNGRGGHRRLGSAYDGSEYGSDTDLDTAGMPPSLVSRIDAIESLARRGTENTGGPADGVFNRLTDGLKDLGSQSSVEGSTTRYVILLQYICLSI